MPEEWVEDAAPQRPALRTPRQIESAIEQRIREAIEAGAFDNLATKGKPVALDLKDAYNHDAWFVNRTMKSLGAVPAWMELGKEIDAVEQRDRWMLADFARWLADVKTALLPLSPAEREQRRQGVELRFEDRFERFRLLTEELRQKIDRFNFEVPVRALERPGVWVAHELSRLREPFQALRDELAWGTKAEIESVVAPTPEEARPIEEPEQPDRGRRLLDLWRRLRQS